MTKKVQNLREDEGTSQVRIVNIEQTRAFESVTLENDMELINRIAAVKLTPEDVFIFEAELSSTRVDSYSTAMTRTALESFAAKINTRAAGIPLMANHNTYTYAVGRIFRAVVVESGDGEYVLVIRAYIDRDDENGDGGISAKAIIRKIESGTQKDMSAGFRVLAYGCSICGKPMAAAYGDMYESCGHTPGVRYDGVEAFAWIEDAELVEGSLVYHGATPGTMINKIVAQAARGNLSLIEARGLLSRFGAQESIISELEEPDMKAKELLTRAAAKTSGTLAAALTKRSEEIAEDAKVEEAIDAVGEVIAEVQAENENLVTQLEAEKAAKEEAEAKVAELQPHADAAQAEFDGEVKEALEEGVRALGDKFNSAVVEATLRAVKIEDVRAMKEQYRSIAENLLADVNKTAESSGTTDRARQNVLVDAGLYKTSK